MCLLYVKKKILTIGLSLQVLTLCRPVDSRLEHVDFDTLLQCLSVANLLQVFASLLLERRVIFVAEKLRCPPPTLSTNMHLRSFLNSHSSVKRHLFTLLESSSLLFHLMFPACCPVAATECWRCCTRLPGSTPSCLCFRPACWTSAAPPHLSSSGYWPLACRRCLNSQ